MRQKTKDEGKSLNSVVKRGEGGVLCVSSSVQQAQAHCIWSKLHAQVKIKV